MTIYMGNLSYRPTEEDLKAVAEYGTVQRVVLPTGNCSWTRVRTSLS